MFVSEFKTIVLCADDFGLNAGVSQGILELVRLGRLSAVSCMTNMPDFILHAPELLALKNKVRVGLHFNLTEGTLLTASGTPCFSLNELLIKTHLRVINPSLIADELKLQLAEFVRVMGCVPDFIDGHQHVHQFPVIRRVLLDFYTQQLKSYDVSIRSTSPALSVAEYQLKAKILAMTGGRALNRVLKQASIPHNHYFSGIYDFSPDTKYRDLFRKWLSQVVTDTLIMCHPGNESNEPDVIAATRLIERDYFLSNEFLSDCEEYGIKLA